MRVAYLTAGAGGMFCGSCLHDNTLVAALLRRKKEIVLLPVFTPIRTDETDVSENVVYYGGINVYLQQKSVLFRRLPAFLDRWLDAPGLLRWVIRTPKSTDDLVGQITVSVLKGERGFQGKELERLIAGLRAIGPDLVNLPNAMFMGIAREIRQALDVPVICNLSGEDLFLETLSEPYRSRSFELIRQAARWLNGFVVSNEYYAEYAIDHFGATREQTHVIPLGIHASEFADAHAGELVTDATASSPFTIGYVARICADKGLHLLADAYSQLRTEGRSCRLRVAGYLGRQDVKYLEDIRASLRDKGFEGDFEVRTDIDRKTKVELLSSFDVLSVPTVYRESKGLYLLEAGAAGVPVVQPRHGCFPEVLKATGGGVLVDPGDSQKLAAGIAGLMDDEALRKSLGERARTSVLKSFTDEHMADRTWSLYEQCVSRTMDPVSSA